MELDSLKDIWKEQDMIIANPNDNDQILSMLRKRSQSPIAKMKRNLRAELLAVVVIYSLTIWAYMTSWKGKYWEIALLLFLVAAAFIFYYYRKNKLLKAMQCVACEVKSNLQQQLTTLEKFVRFYFVSATLLTPVVYYVTGLIILFKAPAPVPTGNPLATRIQPILNHITEHSYFTEFIVAGVLVTIGTYFLNVWYLNKLYGQHIKRLKSLLAQMEDVV